MRILFVTLALLTAGGFAAFRWKNPATPAAAKTALAERKTTATVESRDIRFAVTAAGDIGPAEGVSVRPEINGRIATLPVDVGDKVPKDGVLFTLDDKDLQTERASRLIEIERTRLHLERTKNVFERSKQLYEGKLMTLEIHEAAKTEFDLAQNALDRAGKELSITDDRLTKTKIVAPFDCTVLTRSNSVGQAVSGSGGFNSGTEVLTIADLGDMVVNAHINASDITRLSIGQEVNVQVESIPGLALKGKVIRISPQTAMRNNVKGYPARIQLLGKDPRVLPGMTANLAIPVAAAENALAIPLAAVFTENGERFAYVVKDGKFEKRPVRLGVYNYDFSEVLSGVVAGETVSLELPPGQSAPTSPGAKK